MVDSLQTWSFLFFVKFLILESTPLLLKAHGVTALET